MPNDFFQSPVRLAGQGVYLDVYIEEETEGHPDELLVISLFFRWTQTEAVQKGLQKEVRTKRVKEFKPSVHLHQKPLFESRVVDLLVFQKDQSI